MTIPRLLAIAVVCVLGTTLQPSVEATVGHVFAHRTYRAAVAALDRGFPEFVRDLIALTEIPAPAHQEDARASACARLFRDAGIPNVSIDPEGNVLALRPGRGGPLVAIAAHLDTVFPEGTDVHVKRDGSRLSAPGIGDDGLGLATLVALARALDEAGAQTRNDILFVADVGEEAMGNLRGVRYLFTQGAYRNRIRQFVSIDGVGDGSFIVNSSVGSYRYRVTYRGPGGHSYGAFGLVNPANALAGAIEHLSDLRVPSSPRTTFNVGVLGGGTSVNSIPSSVWMEVDLRSEQPSELAKLDASFRAVAAQAAADENHTRSVANGAVSVALEKLGERPSGQTPALSRLPAMAAAAVRRMGLTPEFGSGSTDANLPMSLGVPAITIDAGVPGGRPHAPDEWVDVERTAALGGLQRTLLLVLSVAGLN
jgi:tripeptide aminopeptidase